LDSPASNQKNVISKPVSSVEFGFEYLYRWSLRTFRLAALSLSHGVSYCSCNTVHNLSYSRLTHIITLEVVTELRVDWNISACLLPVVVGVSSPCCFWLPACRTD
jgi:hypothetical protein